MPRKPKAAKPIDLDNVRVARATLDQLAQENPQAFAPDRLPTTAAKLQRALAFDADAPKPFTIRLRPSTLEALAERAHAAETKPATLARQLIEAGLKR